MTTGATFLDGPSGRLAILGRQLVRHDREVDAVDVGDYGHRSVPS
ncbi:MAG TPA: hypothetical protein VKP69_34040 [Isosphaeraceae bacterium]|nr:hypothetical protein [Isosphaeraceae bacterium]